MRRTNLNRTNFLDKIPPSKQFSMERAFMGQHTMYRSIKEVSANIGVPRAQAKAFLVHLLKTGRVSKESPFVQRLKVKR